MPLLDLITRLFKREHKATTTRTMNQTHIYK